MGQNTTEKLKEKLKDEELAQTIEEIIEEKVEQRVQKRLKDKKERKDSKENISRRKFLKKIGLGAAGLGAASLIPSTTALDIRDSEGLKVYKDNSKHLDISSSTVNILNAVLKEQGNRVATRTWVNSNTSSFSGSHNDLRNVNSGDHHSRYTDSEAVTAGQNAGFTDMGDWSTNGSRDLKVHGQRAMVGYDGGRLAIGFGGDFTKTEIESSPLTVNGNVEIPSGNLDIASNRITSSSGAFINFKSAGSFHSITTDGSGSSWQFFDSANSQAIATFNEGGNVEIPNGDLIGRSFTITNGDTNDYVVQLSADGDTNDYFKWKNQNAELILRGNENGNVKVPNGQLSEQGNRVATRTWATGNNIGLGDLSNVTASGEGSGNGLDADTVDGEDASAFADSGHLHDSRYINSSGDSMGGILDLSSNDLEDGTQTIWDATNEHILQARLENDTLSVAGNSVSLGGSASISLGDLDDVSAGGEGSGNNFDADTVDGQHANQLVSDLGFTLIDSRPANSGSETISGLSGYDIIKFVLDGVSHKDTQYEYQLKMKFDGNTDSIYEWRDNQSNISSNNYFPLMPKLSNDIQSYVKGTIVNTDSPYGDMTGTSGVGMEVGSIEEFTMKQEIGPIDSVTFWYGSTFDRDFNTGTIQVYGATK